MNHEMNQWPMIVKSTDTCGGDARVCGTRLSVWGLEHWHRLGWSDAQLLAAYPQLSLETLRQVWDYARQHGQEMDEAIRLNEEA